MEKKKRRASFTLPPKQKDPVNITETEPNLYPPKQVVEVISDDDILSKKPKIEEEIEEVQEINEIHQTKQPKVYEEEEKKEEEIKITSKVIEEKPQLLEIFGEDEEAETIKKEATTKHVASHVTHETPQEVTVVASAEVVQKPQVRILTHTREEEINTRAQEKATVAELFGKGSESTMPEITVHKNNGRKSIILWAITMLAIALGVGGGLILFTTPKNPLPKDLTNQNIVPTITPQSTPQSTIPVPTATPTTEVLNRKDLKIQVQNGGGVVGAGAKMKTFLEDKGYTVADVGNADSYSYETTVIRVKQSKSSIINMLASDLGSEYTIGTKDATLAESSPYDARVIVGKK